MSGFLPSDARVALLNYLCSGTTYLGLATAIPNSNDLTLANITEVTTGGYIREAVTWGAATSTNMSVDPVTITNTVDVNFPAVTADMTPAPYAFLTDTASGKAIGVPVVTKGTTASSGGTFTAGTYYWVVTAINAKGETTVSNEISATLVSSGTQAMSWASVSGATGYKVYRGTSAGSENTLVTTLGAVTSYTDTGGSGTAATPPTLNTAAIGKILYLWQLVEAVRAPNGKPIKCPAGGLVIE